MTYKQEPPFSVQIELVEGCQLRCSFCGLNGIRSKDNNFKFMELDTLQILISEIHRIKWNPRIEFAMHGEPSFHPNLIKMMSTARKFGPTLHLMMTSNGGGLLKSPGPYKNITALFEAGLNVLALDNYEDVSIVPKIIEQLPIEWNIENESAGCLCLISGSLIDVFKYPANSKGNPHRRRKPHEKIISIVKDISVAVKGTHARLANHAGAAAPKNNSQAGKRCAKPFREMSVRWDGNVAICCDSWRGNYKCGNIVTDGVEAMWNGPAFHAARKKLIRGERDFGDCKGCDARSYRIGLLPDKLGKITLPKPDEKDLEAINKALAGKPYTTPVRRPWE